MQLSLAVSGLNPRTVVSSSNWFYFVPITLTPSFSLLSEVNSSA